jgi:hypothetical protein
MYRKTIPSDTSGVRMKLNKHGIFGLCAMICVAVIAYTRKGSFIPVMTILIVLYGAALLAMTAAGPKNPSRAPTERGSDRNAVQINIISLHTAFALILLTFFIGLRNQPLINLALAPLALFVTYCFAQLVLTPTTEGIELNPSMLVAIIPVAVLVSVTVLEKWNPIWYFYAALTCYCFVLGAYSDDQEHIDFRVQLGIYSALIFFSLGLLFINVNEVGKPHWMHSAYGYHVELRILVLIGCAIAGFAIPYLLLAAKEHPSA